MKKKSLGFCLLFCLALPCLAGCGNRFSKELDRLLHGKEENDAQTTTETNGSATLRGKINNSFINGAPMASETPSLSGILVSLSDLGLYTATSGDGSFVFTNVPSGAHTLIAEHSNNFKIAQKVLISAGQNLDLGAIDLKETGFLVGNAALADSTTHADIDVYVPGTSLLAKTAANGNFVIFYVPAGTLDLKMSKAGYKAVELSNLMVASKQATQVPSQLLEKDEEVSNLLVLPNNTWFDTGVDIKIGQVVAIEASGTITVDQSVYAHQNSQGMSFGPNGSEGTSKVNRPNVQGWMFTNIFTHDATHMYTYALIGKIISQDGGSKFLVGKRYTDNSLEGRLYLAVNTWTGGGPDYGDSGLGSTPDVCSGQFDVKIILKNN